MKTIITTAIAAIAGGLFLTSCEVEQTQEGKLPEVDVEVEKGQLPKFDVDAPEVDVKMKEKTIKVPDIEITPAGEDNDLPEDEGEKAPE